MRVRRLSRSEAIERNAEIIRLRESGLSVREIAKNVGWSRCVVVRVCFDKTTGTRKCRREPRKKWAGPQGPGYLPTPEEIGEKCAEIRAGWPQKLERVRHYHD